MSESGDRRLRLFVAVFPPPEAQRAAFAMEEALRRPEDRVSWVKLENLHYTMRFIGEVGEDGARRVEEAAVEAAAAVPAFAARLGGLGAFPDSERPRVLWVGLAKGGRELIRLARALDPALERHGFGRADKPFTPHLTLGRIRDPHEYWTRRLAAVPVPEPTEATFAVDRLSVVESVLSPRGSTYTIRLDARLGAAAKLEKETP